jgi:hypothetical protein
MTTSPPSAADFSDLVEEIVRVNFGFPSALSEEARASIAAIYNEWALKPHELANLAQTGPSVQQQLRIGRTTVLRLDRAWQPLLFGAALAAVLVLTGGITAVGAVALGDRAVQFVRSFTRIKSDDVPVFEAVCLIGARGHHDGATLLEVQDAVTSDVDRETVERRLHGLQRQAVVAESGGRWKPTA